MGEWSLCIGRIPAAVQSFKKAQILPMIKKWIEVLLLMQQNDHFLRMFGCEVLTDSCEEEKMPLGSSVYFD